MRIYLAGKIGRDGIIAYRRFLNAMEYVESEGHDPVNPIEGPPPWDEAREVYIRRGIYKLLTCDAIYAISGWEGSAGAELEMSIAKQIGLKLFT